MGKDLFVNNRMETYLKGRYFPLEFPLNKETSS
jgi:hypothetical protein